MTEQDTTTQNRRGLPLFKIAGIQINLDFS